MFFQFKMCNELIDLYKALSKFDDEDIKYYSFLDIHLINLNMIIRLIIY